MSHFPSFLRAWNIFCCVVLLVVCVVLCFGQKRFLFVSSLLDRKKETAKWLKKTNECWFKNKARKNEWKTLGWKWLVVWQIRHKNQIINNIRCTWALKMKFRNRFPISSQSNIEIANFFSAQPFSFSLSASSKYSSTRRMLFRDYKISVWYVLCLFSAYRSSFDIWQIYIDFQLIKKVGRRTNRTFSMR